MTASHTHIVSVEYVGCTLDVCKKEYIREMAMLWIRYRLLRIIYFTTESLYDEQSMETYIIDYYNQAVAI